MCVLFDRRKQPWERIGFKVISHPPPSFCALPQASASLPGFVFLIYLHAYSVQVVSDIRQEADLIYLRFAESATNGTTTGRLGDRTLRPWAVAFTCSQVRRVREPAKPHPTLILKPRPQSLTLRSSSSLCRNPSPPLLLSPSPTLATLSPSHQPATT